jgi:hypothetical protein
MAAVDEELRHLLAPLDPVLHDPPPPAGSDRHEAIFAAATGDDVALEPMRRSPRHPWRWGAAAAAAIVAAGAGVIVRNATSDPAESRLSPSEVTSFEMLGTEVRADGSTVTFHGRVDGEDLELVADGAYDEGEVGRVTFVTVGGFNYVVGVDGQTQREPLRPDDPPGLPEYGEMSTEYAALLDSSDVTNAGTAVIDGVLTTHYVVPVTARTVAAVEAMGSELLPDSVEDLVQLGLWYDGDFLRRVDTVYRDGRTETTTIFNLNGDITITAPPGPYLTTPDQSAPLDAKEED